MSPCVTITVAPTSLLSYLPVHLHCLVPAVFLGTCGRDACPFHHTKAGKLLRMACHEPSCGIICRNVGSQSKRRLGWWKSVWNLQHLWVSQKTDVIPAVLNKGDSKRSGKKVWLHYWNHMIHPNQSMKQSYKKTTPITGERNQTDSLTSLLEIRLVYTVKQNTKCKKP